MSKRIESKNYTIRRLRGERDILRRVAQAPVKGVQQSDGKEKEESMHAKVVQESVDNEREELLNSALQQIKKLEKRLDRVRAELEGEENKNLYLQAQLQPMQEARAEDKEIGLAPVFVDKAHFTKSLVDDTYVCAVARQNALAVQVVAKFGNNSATTKTMQGTTRRKSLPSEAEDQGGFHFI